MRKGNHKNIEAEEDENGRRQGYEEYYDDEGTFWWKGYFKNDKEIGYWEEYSPGKKSIEFNYYIEI